MNEILRVDHLSVQTAHPGVRTDIIHDVSFTVHAGEVFSIVGESGSGKTTLACALTRLLPPAQLSVRGSVHFGGRDVLALPDAGVRGVLRSHIRYLFQEPGQSLNPLSRISAQLAHAFDPEPAHTRRCAELFTSFGLTGHDELLRSYPHQLSIGTLQRILLAVALAVRPRLLIADEPTSAIDSLVKFQMMDAIRALTRQEELAVIFITHDLTLARRYADRTAVLSGGRLART